MKVEDMYGLIFVTVILLAFVAIVPLGRYTLPSAVSGYAVSGAIYPNGSVNVNPLYLISEMGEETNATGSEYVAQFLGNGSHVLKEKYFDLFEEDGGFSGFFFVTQVPLDTKKIILKKGIAAIATISISPRAPVITLLDANIRDDKYISIEWNASDADGDALWYTLYHNDSNSNWSALFYDLQITSFKLSKETLSGGLHSFKIRASDGFNVDEKVSNEVFVEYKDPTAIISSPENNSAFILNEDIILEGFGYDAEDGFIRDSNSLKWKIDNNLVGFDLDVNNLALGPHTITLEVIDLEGRISSDTINIEVTAETKPDITIKELQTYPPELKETAQGNIEGGFILQGTLFNIRTDAFCDVSIYGNKTLVNVSAEESFGLLKSYPKTYLPANEKTYFPNKLMELLYGIPIFTPTKTGNYNISIKISDCNPEESSMNNNEASILLRALPYDTTPPNITLRASPVVLWPPNNKLVNVIISGKIVDDNSGVDAGSISLIVDNVKKDVVLSSDGIFSITVPLLAAGAGKNSTYYLINITASDNAENKATRTAVVAVPRDWSLENVNEAARLSASQNAKFKKCTDYAEVEQGAKVSSYSSILNYSQSDPEWYVNPNILLGDFSHILPNRDNSFMFGENDFNQWFIIDLGQTRDINKVESRHSGYLWDRYVWEFVRISTSLDKTSWESWGIAGPYSKEGNMSSVVIFTKPSSTAARYVKYEYGKNTNYPWGNVGSRVFGDGIDASLCS